MWSTLGPLLIELAREWIREGRPSEATAKTAAEAILSQLENIGSQDLDTLGKNMVIQGHAFQEMAKNLKPSDYKAQPMRSTSEGDVDTRF